MPTPMTPRSFTVPAYMPHLPREEVRGYAIGPFGIYKYGRPGHAVWTIVLFSSGNHLYRKLDCRTRAQARAKVERLIALGVDWTKDDLSKIAGSTEAALTNLLADIRAIAEAE
ncbi:MAG: hypothetical protein KGN33_08175 [Paracoccaceae bacterium]|nr:hypothetical protein [Paracoccaceae bacterium]